MVNRVLDTNVLLDRPLADVIASFNPCKITIPLVVLKELDKFKTSDNELLRFHSRAAARYLDTIRTTGSLESGVKLPSGHILRVELNYANVDLPEDLNTDIINDYRILKVAIGLRDDSKSSSQAGWNADEIILVTQDTYQRVLAGTLGIVAENYGENLGTDSSLFTGWRRITLQQDEIDELYSKRRLYLSGYPMLLNDIQQNEYVMFTNITNPSNVGTAKFDGESLIPFNPNSKSVSGIKPLNIQQRFYLDLLMDPEIKVVTAIGGSGCGKTLLAVAAALEQLKGYVNKNGIYNKLTVTRSALGADHDIGFLPGSEFEKMSAWLASITDSLEFIFKDYEGGAEEHYSDLFNRHKIEYKSMMYMRGRSLHNQFVIIEEAQNLTEQGVKLLLTRVSEGTKMVVIGDIEQIDNARLSEKHNGLVHLVDAFKGLPFYGHVTMPKVERSDVAEAAVKLL